ncbi:MAG: HAMP domain-containing histidine kinase [Bacilli bacterium]|nr:HAMP domain-containing histidine kinase [Bacilli bacterium]
MIKKLKRKFILISLLSVLIVLAVTFIAINVSNFVSIENDASLAVSEVIKQGTDDLLPPGGEPGGGQERKVELREVHYFIVSFNQDGSMKEANTKHMFIVSEDECKNLAKKVYDNELSGNKYNTFRFNKELKDDGLTYVGFVDIKEKLDSANQYLLISSLIALGAFIAFAGLVIVGSNIVFKSTEEAYKNQKRFVTNASHELKTPLTIISADLDLIEMDSGKNEWSESIRDQLTRLNEMTNQLVTLSKLEEEDKTRFPFEDFSINEVCNKAIDAFSPSFKKEGIKFSYNIAGNMTMFGNKYLIDELLYIFLDNSFKYTGGEMKSSYFVVSTNAKGKIEFRFSNTINKDEEVDPKQIMDRFYRSPSTKKEGSGVGLSIAKEIINLHHGTIKIDKNPTSLTFIITF